MEKELNYIKPEKGCFYENENGLLSYKASEDYGRVKVLRMFPFKLEEEFLSVRVENFSRNDKNSEIGIIRDLSVFPDKEKEFVRAELKRRYFVPEITSVTKVKEEFGNTMWTVETNAGPREFTVTDMGANLLNLGNGKLILIDVYGNRYMINDVYKISDKALKIVEIWI